MTIDTDYGRFPAIAQFDKVAFGQFVEDMRNCFDDQLMGADDLVDIYNRIRKPERKTRGSAGYDFSSPIDIRLNPGEVVTIPTGIRVKISPNYVLMMYMRSGLGFKHGLRLINGTGIIDSDYYGSNNQGHIMIKLINDSSVGHTIEIRQGDGIAQGIFVPFGLAIDDKASGIRNGGFGSTDINKEKTL